VKTILYVFAFVWFLIGLGALIGGQQIGMGVLHGGAPSLNADAVSDTATLGWFWLWTFPMPSLLAGALGAVLGRLDEIREAIDFANERDAPNNSQPVPEERMDPYIGEGYLDTHTGRKHPSSIQDHTLS
jgi:hypothetical protein